MSAEASWPAQIHAVLQRHGVSQVAYVPDAGHTELIKAAHADPDMTAVMLTTEEEGVALALGAWAGGAKACLLMQSSGVGNCINMLSLMQSCQAPLLALVTMRGEYGEGNPWQIPMGRATPGVLREMGVDLYRADHPEDAAATVDHAATMAYDGGAATAVLLSQKMIGAKAFAR